MRRRELQHHVDDSDESEEDMTESEAQQPDVRIGPMVSRVIDGHTVELSWPHPEPRHPDIIGYCVHARVVTNYRLLGFETLP